MDRTTVAVDLAKRVFEVAVATKAARSSIESGWDGGSSRIFWGRSLPPEL